MKTLAEIQLLLRDFNNQSIAKKSWTHEAHLIVALLYLKQYDYYDAICRLRSGIILLNKQHDTSNHAQGGYHETLTIFWVTVVDFYVKKIPALTDIEIVNSFLASPLANKSLPFLFYEREKVLSSYCRAFFVDPEKLKMDDKNLLSLLENRQVTAE